MVTATAEMKTRDLRVESIRPLVPPSLLLEELPLTAAQALEVSRSRDEVSRIVNGEDDRLIAIVGPCSVHDSEAALDYARRLRQVAGELADELCIVMRVYFEKPRTTVGWKGLLNDPRLDGSYAINEGLRLGRRTLLEVLSLGLPSGCEFLDPISPQYFADTVSWGAIGARTTESQVHRQLASGLSMPVGFKNGTDGGKRGLQVAIDGVRAAMHPHSFLGVTEQGLAAIVVTRGNPDCHVILRGGEHGTNYDAASIEETLAALQAAKLSPHVIVDTSHGNSGKDHRRQPGVAQNLAAQIAAGQRGIAGVAIESFLVEGRQDMVDRDRLVYGQSITDACIDWETTVPILRDLAQAVHTRRTTLGH